MFELITELFQYQAWADTQILAAVRAHPPAAADARICELLHHIVAVQRYFLDGTRPPEEVPPFQAIEAQYAEIAQLAPTENIPTTHLVQTVLHSQHHRGQIAMRLRELGGAPPVHDYIIWKRKQA